jgi:hypothetical protein
MEQFLFSKTTELLKIVHIPGEHEQFIERKKRELFQYHLNNLFYSELNFQEL